MSGVGEAATVGGVLKEGRQRAGLTLQEIAKQTCIRRTYLEALEADRFDLLPGEVYIQGFTRVYAEVLGLDAAPLLAQIRQLKEARGVLVEEAVVSDSNSAGLPAILLWALLALIVIGVGGGLIYKEWRAGLPVEELSVTASPAHGSEDSEEMDPHPPEDEGAARSPVSTAQQ